MNLPMGPTAVGEQWRAPARLGAAIHGSICWTASKRIKVVFTTRVMEKDSWFTSLVLSEVLNVCGSQGMLSGRQTVVFWPDGGPHYRSVVQLSNYAWWVPEARNCHTEATQG